MGQNLENQLAELLKKLGIGIDEGLPLLIRFAVADALVGIVGSIVVLVIIYFLGRYIWAETEDSFDRGALRGIWGGLLGFVGLVCLLIVFNNISILIEPRGYLISKIVK